MSTSRFSASRTAEVATAVIGASCTSATWRNRSRAATARSMASSLSSRMSPGLEPRRTISFSRSRISKRGPPSPAVMRATTPWTEFVPMSTAASVSVAGSDDVAIAGQSGRVAGGPGSLARHARPKHLPQAQVRAGRVFVVVAWLLTDASPVALLIAAAAGLPAVQDRVRHAGRAGAAGAGAAPRRGAPQGEDHVSAARSAARRCA